MIRYEFADETPTLGFKNADKADPQVIGGVLEAISDAHAGRLDPHDVVDEARPAASPLHGHFEWDDALAAEQYRLGQARAIIRAVRVVGVNPNEAKQRAFISVSDNAGRAYRPLRQIIADPALQLAVMRQGLEDLRAWRRRYADLADICPLVEVAERGLETKLAEREPAV
jgi:hypothetical protein